ncbi:FxSxx-COOH cyclophane-containing RiPP peptide [Streptomyces sp. NPDC101118]|uniref:FxSxx-COOH cyclophane-containing RiPP peptide n=1 Tax=Streptomyces sp. NPDC101118 TaxID=3366109 RepID=UPI00382E340E
MSRLPIVRRRVKSTPTLARRCCHFHALSSHRREGPQLRTAVKTSVTSSTSAGKNRRVPLADIDVRSTAAAAALSRVLPSESGRPVQTPIFNSAL